MYIIIITFGIKILSFFLSFFRLLFLSLSFFLTDLVPFCVTKWRKDDDDDAFFVCTVTLFRCMFLLRVPYCNCFSFHFSKRPLVIFNYEIRELVVFSDFIAKIYPFRPYTTNMYLYTTIVCSTCYKYLFRPSLYLCTSAIQI